MKKSLLSTVELIAITMVLAIGTITMTITTPTTTYATTGMSNCTQDPEREDCNPQPDRVGNDGSGNNNDADRDGPGGV